MLSRTKLSIILISISFFMSSTIFASACAAAVSASSTPAPVAQIDQDILLKRFKRFLFLACQLKPCNSETEKYIRIIFGKYCQEKNIEIYESNIDTKNPEALVYNLSIINKNYPILLIISPHVKEFPFITLHECWHIITNHSCACRQKGFKSLVRIINLLDSDEKFEAFEKKLAEKEIPQKKKEKNLTTKSLIWEMLKIYLSPFTFIFSAIEEIFVKDDSCKMCLQEEIDADRFACKKLIEQNEVNALIDWFNYVIDNHNLTLIDSVVAKNQKEDVEHPPYFERAQIVLNELQKANYDLLSLPIPAKVARVFNGNLKQYFPDMYKECCKKYELDIDKECCKKYEEEVVASK